MLRPWKHYFSAMCVLLRTCLKRYSTKCSLLRAASTTTQRCVHCYVPRSTCSALLTGALTAAYLEAPTHKKVCSLITVATRQNTTCKDVIPAVHPLSIRTAHTYPYKSSSRRKQTRVNQPVGVMASISTVAKPRRSTTTLRKTSSSFVKSPVLPARPQK